MQSITSLATTPPAPNDPNSTQAFDGVNKSIPVYVPAASINAYRTADQWKDFTNIRAIGSGALNPDHPQNPGNYRLTLNVSDEAAGSVTGAGLYPQGTAVTITATANTGYSFTQWSDGVTDASRTVTLMRDSTLTASTIDALLTVTARQWFAIGVPFEVNVASGIQINGANAADIFGTDYAMDEYDGALRASVQDDWKRVASAGTLHPGTLYMIYTASATSWRLIAANPAAIAEAEAVAVAANPSSLGEHHAGWNGIANARLSNSSASLNGVTYATFYNNQYSVYETVIMAEQPLIPAEPFFVQAPAAGSVLFEADDAAPAPWRVAATDMPTMTVALTNEAQTFTDKAYITTSQDKPNTYTIGRDLEKMQAAAPVVPQLWIEAYNMHLAAYETSFTGNGQIIPLGLYAPAQGSYTIAISNVPTDLDITLTKNGQTIWDITESAYVASLQAGNNAGYALRISQKSDVVTDINTLNGENTNATVRKMIINGQLIILHGDKAYTTHGQELR